jgi:hypothetical protein
MILLSEESNQNAPPSACPPQNVVQFCPLPGQVHHLKWWLTQCFADNEDILHMSAKMCSVERTDIQLKFQEMRNLSVFIPTPTVGGIGMNHTTPNHAVITEKFWVLNELQQAFAQVIQLAQNRVPHTWLLYMGTSGFNYGLSDDHQHSGVAEMRVLHGRMS